MDSNEVILPRCNSVFVLGNEHQDCLPHQLLALNFGLSLVISGRRFREIINLSMHQHKVSVRRRCKVVNSFLEKVINHRCWRDLVMFFQTMTLTRPFRLSSCLSFRFPSPRRGPRRAERCSGLRPLTRLGWGRRRPLSARRCPIMSREIGTQNLIFDTMPFMLHACNINVDVYHIYYAQIEA